MALCHNLGELKSTRQAPLWHRASALISPRLSGHPQHQEWAPCPHDPGQYGNRHQKKKKKSLLPSAHIVHVRKATQSLTHKHTCGEKKKHNCKVYTCGHNYSTGIHRCSNTLSSFRERGMKLNILTVVPVGACACQRACTCTHTLVFLSLWRLLQTQHIPQPLTRTPTTPL